MYASARESAPAIMLSPRAGVVEVLRSSGDIANQYVSVMNSIFAAQRQKVPVDIVKIAGDTVFLQQASEATGGVYMKLEYPDALLQYLMVCPPFICVSNPTDADIDGKYRQATCPTPQPDAT